MSYPLTTGFLATDQYQLTMAQLYLRQGIADQRAQFDHTFRSYPDYGTHRAGYCVAAGLDGLVAWLQTARLDTAGREALASHITPNGNRLFDDSFLEWLGAIDPTGVTLEAVPEGRVVHANVPMTTVTGPLAVAQLLETPLLNHLNYPTLIATKASRVAEAARGRPILEFGLRRGPENGAAAGARAAIIGGAAGTSHVGAAAASGLQASGTHGHSLVQAFLADGGSELDAFRAYADSYPDSCLLVVDTIDTLDSGVPNAIRTFEELRAGGYRPLGIRLDSGDLAYLAIQAARLLNQAGFDDVGIVLSSGLDEITIWQIVSQITGEAPRYGVDADRLIARLSFGVGGRLTSSDGSPVLDGVYKLVALHTGGEWAPAIKVSNTPLKVPHPGRKEVWRFYDVRGRATADVIAIAGEDVTIDPLVIHHPFRPGMSRALAAADVSKRENMLEIVIADGAVVHSVEPLAALRDRRDRDVDLLDPGVRRLVNPHRYHVSLSAGMWELKRLMVARARSNAHQADT